MNTADDLNAASLAAARGGVPVPPVPVPVDTLTAGLRAAAPGADPARWLPPIRLALAQYDINTPRRIAAWLGQVAVEAGPSLAETVENLNYTHAARICQVFPREFPTADSAAACVSNPQALANRCYAGKLGNGNEASGDGWRFRGRGLIQITGRAEYAALAADTGRTPEAAAAWCETPEGAAASAGWYWRWRNVNSQADLWNLAAVTAKVNGAAMEGYSQRVAASKAALAAMGGT